MTINKRKKIIAAISGIVFIAIVGIGGMKIVKNNDPSTNKQVVYVEQVGDLVNSGADYGRIERFSGIVETQKQVEVNPAPDRPIKELLVAEGQNVSAGTILFKYDVEKEIEKLAKLQIELERIDNTIQNKKNEMAELEKEKKTVSGDAQLDYTMQIQSAQTELKQNEYERKAKDIEITKLKSTMENSEVVSEINGVVKQINKDHAESSAPFLTLISVGEYRIKGKINEQNMGVLSTGQKVLVHSRTDEDAVWTGTVSEIDTKKPVNKGMEDSGSEAEQQSSSYPFYVNLDGSAGLMLGQHVYIEPDFGQQKKRKGVWLDEGYIIKDGGQAYVWADNGQGKLEKKKIKLGRHDKETFQYEITGGLHMEDKVTFPNPELKDGLRIVDSSMEE